MRDDHIDLCGQVDFTRTEAMPLLERESQFCFACAGCGDCCRGREDIVLSGFDLIDFSTAKAVDGLLDYCETKKVPVVLCTTGLSEDQLNHVKEASKVDAVLRSANMSLRQQNKDSRKN